MQERGNRNCTKPRRDARQGNIQCFPRENCNRVYRPKHCHQCINGCNPAETPYCITEALIRAAQGDIENGLLFCGAKAYKAEKIETVHSVIESFFE